MKTRDEAQQQHFEVADMVDACRCLWYKTRERAARKGAAQPALEDVLDLLASMCGQPTPIFNEGVPDWDIVCSWPKDLEATIRKQPVTYLETLLFHVLCGEGKLDRDFQAYCRRLGRDLRRRDFLLEAQAMYKFWAEEPDWDISFCPFPPSMDREAKDLLAELAEDLVAWSLPRHEAIEAAFREYIHLHPPQGEMLYICGLVDQPLYNPYARRRQSPPLHTFLPKIACARIFRALAIFRAVREEDLSPADDRMQEALADTDAAIGHILDRYRANLRQAGVTSAQIFADILNHDWNASAEELLGEGKRRQHGTC